MDLTLLASTSFVCMCTEDNFGCYSVFLLFFETGSLTGLELAEQARLTDL